MAFPTIFPDGLGDPTDNKTVFDRFLQIKTDSYAKKLKHFVKFGEFINGKCCYRFASHLRFSYWTNNILYSKRLLSQANF